MATQQGQGEQGLGKDQQGGHQQSPQQSSVQSPNSQQSQPSILFSPTARSQDGRSIPLPPVLDRQQSTQLVGRSSSSKGFLSFAPPGIKSPPSAPPRSQEEGVTAASRNRHQAPRRQGSGSRSARRSASSLIVEEEAVSSEEDAPRVTGEGRGGRRRSSRRRRRDQDTSHERNLLKQTRDALRVDQEATDIVSNSQADGIGERSKDNDASGDGEGDGSKVKSFVGKLRPTRLIDLHERQPDLRGMSLLPTVHFPGQGSGEESEFLQPQPIWARQPWKYIYMTYFGLSVGLVFLPYFAVASLNPEWRARSSWTWKRSTLVRLYRHGTRLTFRTHTSLSRDLSKAVPHSATLRCKFVWIQPTPEEDICGELRRAMKKQQIASVRTCGFWYGEPLKGDLADAAQCPAGSQGVGRQAGVDEKVVYHLHGGAYWIGTAHEKDVTAAVNTEILRYLDEIYKSGSAKSRPTNRCTRSLSLDYRLCVPHRPRLGSYPAALLDALAGYIYLIRHCGFKAKNIIVAGDSAGGNLALALCRYLRDEKVEDVPGSLLLLSPWADISRSHAGPLSAPNRFSTVFTNRNVDIISPSVAFRNTAVQAFLGELTAREAYHNPYLSSCSLQLPPEAGGDGPNWGFEGMPKRTYLVSGSGEISNDQHLTLAHRMAAGTARRVPIYTGDALSKGCDPYEMAARLSYPRPVDHTITLWQDPDPVPPMRRETETLAADSGKQAWQTEELKKASEPRVTTQNVDKSPVREGAPVSTDKRIEIPAAAKLPCPSPKLGGDHHSELKPCEENGSEQVNISANASGQANASGAGNAYGNTNGNAHARLKRPTLVPLSSGAALMRAQSRSNVNTPASGIPSRVLAPLRQDMRFAGEDSEHNQQEEEGADHSDDEDESDDEGDRAYGEGGSPDYFGVGGEKGRKVWLDEVKDGVHDLLLFPWHEPERGACWRRIAKWIDEDSR